jgi:NAD(P)-dependent dehydrogenase (short-subunit alcohol dehydrogenase family)
VAAAIVWLASDDGAWITGQTIPINGGYRTS